MNEETALNHQKWELIESLDLSAVKEKLRGKKSWWWNLWHDVDKLEKEYKQFLYLIATNPGETVVPWSQDMDDLWHEHILDMAKYHADCLQIFGQYIHHNPHLPVGSPAQRVAFANTRTMYKTAFGDKAKKRKDEGGSACGGAGCGVFMPVVFCSTHVDAGHHGGDGHSCGGA